MKMEHRYSTKAFWQKVKDEYHPTQSSRNWSLFSSPTFKFTWEGEHKKEFIEFCVNYAHIFLSTDGKWFMQKYEELVGDKEVVYPNGFLFRVFPYINYDLQIRYKFIEFMIFVLTPTDKCGGKL